MHPAPVHPAPVQSAPPANPAARQALPRRQKQASLAPQLRDSGPAPIEDVHDGFDGPSPDSSRALVESLQYGLDMARSAPPDADEPWPDGSQAWPDNPWQSTDAWPTGNWSASAGPDHTASAEDAEGQ